MLAHPGWCLLCCLSLYPPFYIHSSRDFWKPLQAMDHWGKIKGRFHGGGKVPCSYVSSRGYWHGPAFHGLGHFSLIRLYLCGSVLYFWLMVSATGVLVQAFWKGLQWALSSFFQPAVYSGGISNTSTVLSKIGITLA